MNVGEGEEGGYATLLLDEFTNHPQPNSATVLALIGDLGAGKTTLVQALARELGITDVVTSPTFVVMKSYETTNTVFTTLVHIDAYRIDDVDEMRPLGFLSLLTQPNTLLCIEWPERIASLLPTKRYTLSLFANPDGSRTNTYHGH